MPRYTNELDALRDLESALRHSIALRIAEEAGQPRDSGIQEQDLAKADATIARWEEEGEEEQDLAAFRPIGPLQRLLIEHQGIMARIAEVLDRRLS